MIELNNVCKVYHTAAGDVTALKGVTLTLPDSGLVFLVGKSGSGKTTLLNLLGGLDVPTSGTIAYGEDRKCGYVFQDIGLFPFLRVGENMRLSGASDEECRRCLAVVGMAGFERRRTRTLSGGEQQRVAVARMLARDPSFILADEPTGALDSENARQVFEVLKSLSAERLVVVVTHDRESAERYGDVIYRITDGQVAEERTAVLSGKRHVRHGEIKDHISVGLACRFALRQVKTSKMRSALCCLLLALLMSVLCICVSILSVTPADIAWNYLQENDLRYIELEYLLPNGENGTLDSDVRAYLFSNTDAMLTRITKGEHEENVGIANHPYEFVTVSGDASGAILLRRTGEEAQVGEYAFVFGEMVLVSGTVATENFSPYETDVLPNVIFTPEAWDEAGLGGYLCYGVTLLPENLTKEILEYALDEEGLGLRLSNMGTLITEQGEIVKVAEFINAAYENQVYVRNIAAVFGCVLTVVTFLYTAYFTAHSISENRRAIGILKSLGFRDGKIAVIFVLQALLLLAVAILLTVGLTAGGVYWLNYVAAFADAVPITVFMPQALFAVVPAAVFVVYMAAVLLPLGRIKKVRINDLLRSL